MPDTNERKDIRYMREFFMFAILALVAWTLVSTVDTAKNVAVMSAEFNNLKVAVEATTKDRYDSKDADKDFKRFAALLAEKTNNRYTTIDARRDRLELITMIKEHKH
jgi:hypothetical protein